MKDYNFMISDDRPHKTRFCKKKGAADQNFPYKKGGWSKGGGLERFHFFKGGGHTLVPTMFTEHLRTTAFVIHREIILVSSLLLVSLEMFYKKRCSYEFREIHRKHLCQGLFFNGLQL